MDLTIHLRLNYYLFIDKKRFLSLKINGKKPFYYLELENTTAYARNASKMPTV